MRLGVMLLTVALASCRSYEDSVPRPEPKNPSTQTTPTTTSSTSDSSKSTGKIVLPSQQPQNYKMSGERPAEVCMEKGWTWLYKGFLGPQCASCHNKTNKFGVTAFAEPGDEAGSFEVMKSVVNKTVFLSMILQNSFCSSCTIKEADPLYTDLKYFTTHLTTCEKP